jgi:hypothetical protein
MVTAYRTSSSNGGSGRGIGISEAQRNAEALFESQTVVEIREARPTSFLSTAHLAVLSKCICLQ